MATKCALPTIPIPKIPSISFPPPLPALPIIVIPFKCLLDEL